MTILSRNEIIELMQMPFEEFSQTIVPKAKAAYKEARGDVIVATAVLGYSNICKNTCLYCGMRAPNSNLKRFRMKPDEIIVAARVAKDMGFSRIFLLSGEDMGFGFDNILEAVRGVKDLGFFISLAAGEFSADQYAQLRDAGVCEYALKFEMADEAVFSRLNPSSNYTNRLSSIRSVQKSGLRLASGGIVDYPGQTPSQLADDIILARELDISWAPISPYMPAMGTPLAEEGGPGSRETNLRYISIMRILMPGININAQQPGKNLANGLSDEQGNLDALNAGGNILFFDLLPTQLGQQFNPVDNRNTANFKHLERMSEISGMKLEF